VISLLPIFEALFNVTTDMKLLELSNMNVQVLRDLAAVAPGTYHHSIVLGALAEAAAKEVSCNSLLARVACYYHDIGKLYAPEYFIENQRDGFNIHNQLPPEESAKKIIAHVTEGMKYAEKMQLPQSVKDMIVEHHGTKRLHYFYEKALELHGGNAQEVDEAQFRYPGQKPQTREAAIIMLADAVEAASRTIKEPTPEKIRAMIDKIISLAIKEGQFSDCQLAVGHLEKISASFYSVLLGQFHHRIEYQGLDFNKTPTVK
jgi:hypothetical protein